MRLHCQFIYHLKTLLYNPLQSIPIYSYSFIRSSIRILVHTTRPASLVSLARRRRLSTDQSCMLVILANANEMRESRCGGRAVTFRCQIDGLKVDGWTKKHIYHHVMRIFSDGMACYSLSPPLFAMKYDSQSDVSLMVNHVKSVGHDSRVGSVQVRNACPKLVWFSSTVVVGARGSCSGNWSRLARATMLGLPWAHWNGRVHVPSCLTRARHWSVLSSSLNMMALRQARELIISWRRGGMWPSKSRSSAGCCARLSFDFVLDG